MDESALRNIMLERRHGGSVFEKSDAGVYRYVLWQDVSATALPLVFIALNPSTATGDPRDGARASDNTSRRFMHFAHDLGPLYGTAGYVAVNAFALVATDPSELVTAVDPVGHLCDEYIRSALRLGSPCVIAGWGVGGTLRRRHLEILAIASALEIDLMALRVTKDGHPEHPLYLPGNLVPRRYATAKRGAGKSR